VNTKVVCFRMENTEKWLMLVLCVWDQFQINISVQWSTLNLLIRDDFCYGTEKLTGTIAERMHVKCCSHHSFSDLFFYLFWRSSTVQTVTTLCVRLCDVQCFLFQHEMIHAFLFVTHNNRDRDGHGPEFHYHMYRINKEAGTNITVSAFKLFLQLNLL
jgi:hypothetical protein